MLAANPSLINTPDEEGYTPLHLGVINGNKEIVKALISANADVNCMDNEKHSLVHWATGIFITNSTLKCPLIGYKPTFSLW
jgi:ankyrin repeat protein